MITIITTIIIIIIIILIIISLIIIIILRPGASPAPTTSWGTRKETNGVSTTGVTAIF